VTTTATTPNLAVRDAALAMIDKLRAQNRQVLDDLTDEQWFAQAARGTNHAMWVAGHLTTSYGYFAEMLGGTNTAPERYHELFDAKSEPFPNPSIYPPKDEVLAEMDKAYAAMRDAFTALSAEDLDQRFSENFGGFTRIEAALLTLYHDAFHFGQIATARKAQGLTPMFM